MPSQTEVVRDKPWTAHQLVFIGGMHRSGTTLLAKIVGASADASGLTGTGVTVDEGQHLQDVYPAGVALGGVTRWALSEGAHLTERDVVPGAAARLWESWSPYWDLSRRTLVEKTPLNLARMRYLQDMFPGSKFVVITRHPIAQALGIWKWNRSRSGMLGASFPRMVENWLAGHRYLREDSAHVRSLYVMSYEALMRDPARQLAMLADFLNIPLDHATVSSVQPHTMNEYADAWAQWSSGRGGPAKFAPPLDPVTSLARDLLMRRSARIIARRYGPEIREFGYDPADLTSVPPRDR